MNSFMQLITTLMVGLVLIVGVSCRSNPETGSLEADWPAVVLELQDMQMDLKEYKEVFVTDPKAQAIYDLVGEVMHDIEIAIQGYVDGGDVNLEQIIITAANKVPEASGIFTDDPESQERIREIVFAFKFLVRRIV